jgi:hypothetical protein
MVDKVYRTSLFGNCTILVVVALHERNTRANGGCWLMMTIRDSSNTRTAMDAISDHHLPTSFERVTRARPAQIRRCGADADWPAARTIATGIDRVPRALATVGGRASGRVCARQQFAHVWHVVSEKHVIARVVPTAQIRLKKEEKCEKFSAMAKKDKGAHGVRIIIDFHHAPIAFGANQIRA